MISQNKFQRKISKIEKTGGPGKQAVGPGLFGFYPLQFNPAGFIRINPPQKLQYYPSLSGEN